MRICVLVGHSLLKSNDTTSADGTKYGGINEYQYNKKLIKYVVKYLKENGHKVTTVICPEKKFTHSKEERDYKLNIVNNGQYNLIIELHLNAAEDKDASGSEVLYKSLSAKKYAMEIQEQLAKIFVDRGIKYRDNLYMLNATKPTAIIVESFFCTNKNDCEIGKNYKMIGKRIADGIGKA